MYDIIIIGAGITGTMIARNLSKYDLKVALLDENHDIACGATMANSAIVHTGYDPEEGTLKGKLNVLGARMYPEICKDLGCKFETVGAWVVATSAEEEQQLQVLKQRAIDREIPFVCMTGEEGRELEPNLSGQITQILSFPTTGIIYPWEVAIACMQVACKNGVDLFLDTHVDSIVKQKDCYHITAGERSFDTKRIINASGVGAEKIARMVSEEVPYHIEPRKGEYYVLDQNVHVVSHIIFPVPGPKGKGVLVVPTVYGNTLVGPNSSANDVADVGVSVEGLDEVKQQIQKTIVNVPFQKTIRCYAGLRPSSSVKDFVITEYTDAPGFIDVASIASPGLASSPAIAQYVIEEFVAKQVSLQEKENACMTRERPIVMEELTMEEKNAIIQDNPLYGKMICRCERISEGEIVDSIHQVCGARSVKGVKKRVRAGMGRCQGGFCEPRVVEILARELHIDPCDVLLDDVNSHILERENRS